MVTGLIVVGCLLVLGGVLHVSQATLGVYLAAVGCFFAILARIAQSAAQHKSPAKERGGPSGW
jgi:hypothetical protein